MIRHFVSGKAIWAMVAQGGRVFLQAAYFVLIARVLGVQGYGTLAAALAIVYCFAPFAGWGSGSLLLMRSARDPGAFPSYWGNALLCTALSAVPVMLATVGICVWILPSISWQLILVLGMAEFIAGRLTETSAQAFQAFDRMALAAQMFLLPNISRLASALALVTFTTVPTPFQWAVWYLVCGVFAASVAVIVVTKQLGAPRPVPALLRRDFKLGGYFAVGLSSNTVYAEIDKTMLACLATVEATGIYAAAYRATTMAFVPIRALLYATVARFFRHGSSGIEGSLGFAKRILPVALAYGITASIGLYWMAPLTPDILGQEYLASIDVLRWLALLPLLQTLHFLPAYCLTGAGYQGLRSAIHVGVVVLNIGLNLLLIPIHSWKGAVWATLLSDGALAIGLWLTVAFLAIRQDQKETQQ